MRLVMSSEDSWCDGRPKSVAAVQNPYSDKISESDIFLAVQALVEFLNGTANLCPV